MNEEGVSLQIHRTWMNKIVQCIYAYSFDSTCNYFQSSLEPLTSFNKTQSILHVLKCVCICLNEGPLRPPPPPPKEKRIVK